MGLSPHRPLDPTHSTLAVRDASPINRSRRTGRGSRGRITHQALPESGMDCARTQGPAASRRQGKISKLLLVCLVFGLLAGGVALASLSGKLSFRAPAETGWITETVKRGLFEISLTEKGSLESAENLTITSLVEGMTAIIKIVDEGTRVNKGDVVIELDSSTLRTQAIQQQVVVEQAEALEQQAAKNVAIQKTQNESDIAAAMLKLDLARLDLEKYKLGDYIQEKNTYQGELTLAQEDLTRADEKYAFTARLSKKGYATQSELEADRIAVTKARIAADVAKDKLQVLDKYTYKRMIAEMDANAQEFERELERVKLKAAAALAQFESVEKAQKLTAEVERTKFKKMLSQIEVCTVKAPQDGMVVYANSRSNRGNQDVMIYEGAQVRERQAMIYLPDVSKMQVNARIHESKIDFVREKLPCTIRVDALPGELFHGVVDTVSSVPMSGNWPNVNLKEYVTTIAIKDDSGRALNLKPGLTAEVEILVDRAENVLQAPIQAIIERGGRHFAYVAGTEQAERREVKVGRTNDIVMEIKDGLNEGDAVVLNPRSALSKQIAALESEIPVVAPDRGEKKGELPPADTKAKPKAKAGSPEGGNPQRPGSTDRPQMDPLAFFKRIDANSDGKLTADELPDRMKDRFTTMDANSDQSVDLAEWQKASATFRAARAGGPEGAGGASGGPGGVPGGPGPGRAGGAPPVAGGAQ